MVSHKELEPQPSGWGSFFLLFARSRRSPVVVFLRLDSYSHLLSATVSRLGMMFFVLAQRGLCITLCITLFF
jgi:hypothetical protein